MRIWPAGAWFLGLFLDVAATSPNAPAPPEEYQSPEPLRVRIGRGVTREMGLLGWEPDGLRLRPPGEAEGELLVPYREVSELAFVFPATYQEARQARSSEQAVRLLEPWIGAYLPYLRIVPSNATAVVSWYLEQALAAGRHDVIQSALPYLPWPEASAFEPLAWRLARVWLTEDREPEVRALLAMLPRTESGQAHGRALADWACAQERWDVAASLYARLREGEPATECSYAWLALAYCDLRRGQVEAVRARWPEVAAPEPDQAEFGFYQFVAAQLAWHRDDALTALLTAAQALVWSDASAPWRPALLSLLAEAYEARGHGAAAEAVRAEGARLEVATAATEPTIEP